MSRRPKNPRDRAPVYWYEAALQDAQQGLLPPFTTETFLARLGLKSDQKDNRTLLGRLTDSRFSIGAFRAVIRVTDATEELINLANARETNPAQEVLMRIMGAAACRQLEREGDICSTVSELVKHSERDDIIPFAVRQAVAPGGTEIASNSNPPQPSRRFCGRGR